MSQVGSEMDRAHTKPSRGSLSLGIARFGLAQVFLGCLSWGCVASAPHPLMQSTLWVGTSAEYVGAASQAYEFARKSLDEALSDTSWTACVEQTVGYQELPPAVILDIDETVLDNTKYFARKVRGSGASSRSSFTEWVNEASAPLVPGALGFINYARAQHVRVFFVTNRLAEEEEGTRRNLAHVGVIVDTDRDTVLMRNERPEWTRDKATRRSFVAQDHRILLLIGDDYNDFVPAETSLLKREALSQRHRDRWGVSWFVLPNPLYGSWLKAVYGFERGLSDKDKVRRMYAHLAGLE